MRRALVRVAVCVVVGVVVNVLVAWGLFLTQGAWSGNIRSTGFGESFDWPCRVGEGWPSKASRRYESVAPGVKVLTLWAREPTEPGDSPSADPHIDYNVGWFTAGWPLRALGMSKLDEMKWYGDMGTVLPVPVAVGLVERWQRGYRLPKWVTGSAPQPVDGYRLPIWPVGREFAGNTAFFSVMVWVALFAPGAVKRARRRKRGACEACGYELAGLVKCPECGSEVAASRRRG